MTHENLSNLPAIRGSGLPYETALAIRRRAYALPVPRTSSHRGLKRRKAHRPASRPYMIQPDRYLRKQVARLAMCTEILCLVFSFYVLASLNHAILLRDTTPHLAAIEIYQLWCVLAGCGLAIAMGYACMLAFMAFLTLQSRQSPPPGIGVIWETRLRIGLEARNLAVKELLVAGFILLLGSSFVIDLMWSI